MALICAVAGAVVYPLWRPQPHGDDTVAAAELADLEARKQSKYREIRDAEQEFHAGKLSEVDYQQLDSELRSEAISILERIDRLEGRLDRG